MDKVVVKSPFGGSELAEIELANEFQVEKVLDLAVETFNDRSNWIPKYERVAIMKRIASIMRSRVKELVVIAVSEGGKPYKDTEVEVLRAINGVELAIESLSHYEGKEVAMGHTASSMNRMAFTFKEPIGVVAAISAFNHPLNLAVHQTIPAIAVGCPVIIRPSESTPMSALNLIEIYREAGLPEGWAQCVVCSRALGQHIAMSEKIDYLSFIGSSAVGWHLNRLVASGTRVGLEHGGVAPVIVEPDADIEAMLPLLVKGAFYHAGQVCVSVQRVYIHESIIFDVANSIASLAEELQVGDPLDPDTDVGPLIAVKECERVDRWVKEAVAGGAQLLCGGERIGETLYAPTVLLNPPADALVSTQEVFGPVVCLYSYNYIDRAIEQANSLDVSFQASIFTNNIDFAMKAVKQLNATAVMINDHTAFRVDWMPFGGAKKSGLGLGGIPYSMEEMSNQKLMVIKSSAL